MAYTPEKDYLLASLNTSQGINVASGDHIKYNQILASRGSGITFDTTTAYSNSNNTDSVGRFTLTSGKTYKITVDSYCSLANSTSLCYLLLYNANTGTDTNLMSIIHIPVSSTSSVSGKTSAVAIITASTNRYEIRISVDTGSVTLFAHVRNNTILIEEI